MTLTTLARVQSELKGTSVNLTPGAEQQIMAYARTVTDRIRAFGYEFEPLYQVKRLTPTRMTVNSALGLLSLKDDLLEAKSITVGGTAASYGTQIVSEPQDGQTPIRMLRISDPWTGPLQSWYACCVAPGAFYNSIVISGFWGMRQYYTEQGFFDSGVTCPALTATQPTMVVSDIAGPDVYNRTPLFSAGNLLRIDDELLEVVKVDPNTFTLTLRRGSRGSVAATHTIGTAIRIWEPEEDIVNAATRQVCLLYARRGAYQQITSFPDGVNVTYPSDLLAELRATIQRFSYL